MAAACAVLAAIPAYSTVRNSRAPEAVALQRSAVVSDRPAPAGRWELVPERGLVGYRVQEPGNVTVVGRTTELEGQLEVVTAGGLRLTALQVDADLRQLRSDASARDRALRGRILESEQYPEARFRTAGTVPVGAVPPGDPVTVQLPGTLTIRERDTRVVADAELRWDGEVLQAAGRIPIRLSDYAVEIPSAGAVAGLDDDAIVEFDLTFRPAA